MASSRVSDPPHQAKSRDSSMQTDDSAIHSPCHQMSLLLDELEQWATIIPSLFLNQRQEISTHLQEKMSQLATFDEPSGTRKQQFIDLERLAKLQQGPLCKMVDYGGFLTIMDNVITKRLQALSTAVLDVPEIPDSTDSSEILTPASSVGTELGNLTVSQSLEKDLEDEVTLSLEHAILTPSGQAFLETRYEKPQMGFWARYLKLRQKDGTLIVIIAEGEVKCIKIHKKFGWVDLRLKNGDNWYLTIEDDKNADILSTWIFGQGKVKTVKIHEWGRQLERLY